MFIHCIELWNLWDLICVDDHNSVSVVEFGSFREFTGAQTSLYNQVYRLSLYVASTKNGTVAIFAIVSCKYQSNNRLK